jgi:enoyl-[acyl-carrier protein] reductase II
MQVVPTVTYAIGAEEAGVDAIVAEGSESGGSTSLEEISTMVLIPQVVDAVRCPVIAAGGIGDGRGMAAVMALGAVGVQMGTLFMATEECEISRAFKELLIMARETDTRMVRYERGPGEFSRRCILKILARFYKKINQTLGPLWILTKVLWYVG